jgi:hypothetical protein
LIRGPWAQSYAHLVPTDGIDDCLGHLEHEARPILHRTAIQIRPLVTVRLQKLVREIPERGMNLHAVKPGPENSVPSCGSVQLHILPDLFHRQRARHRSRGCAFFGFVREWDRDRARRDERVPAFFLKGIWGCAAPERPELEEDERPVFVHRIHDLSQRERRGSTSKKPS